MVTAGVGKWFQHIVNIWFNNVSRDLGPVSRKSRNFTVHFRVWQFPLYLKNGEGLSRQTSQSFCFLLPWKRVKRSAFQKKRTAVFSPRNAAEYFSTFEEKFRISARPCNILYLLYRQTGPRWKGDWFWLVLWAVQILQSFVCFSK